jgi:hypothetical protein
MNPISPIFFTRFVHFCRAKSYTTKSSSLLCVYGELMELALLRKVHAPRSQETQDDPKECRGRFPVPRCVCRDQRDPLITSGDHPLKRVEIPRNLATKQATRPTNSSRLSCDFPPSAKALLPKARQREVIASETSARKFRCAGHNDSPITLNQQIARAGKQSAVVP